jgi:hypothetical protein
VTAPIAFGTGLVAGIVLDVLTFFVARYGPSGSDAIAWSFRGNGALIVPFGLGSAVLAGGWTALVLHGRPGVRWLRWGIAAGLVGAGIFLADAGATMTGTVIGISVATVLTLANLVWMVVAPALAVIVFRGGEYQPQRLQHVLAEVLFAVGAMGGFFVAELVLSPGS